MKEAVAAAVAVEPVLDVGPAPDVVHRLVLDQLLDQRGRRVPADAAQLEEADVEPGREHVLHLGIQRQQAPVGLQVRQHLGAHVHQEAHAIGSTAEALQQAPARRHRRAAQAHLGQRPRRACPRRRAYSAARALHLLQVEHELLAHEQPAVAPLVECGARAYQAAPPLGAAPALDLAHARVDDRLQLGQRPAQRARRQRLVVAAQCRVQPLGQRARADAGSCFRRLRLRSGLLGFGGVAAGRRRETCG